VSVRYLDKRGDSRARRNRRAWLLETFRADVDLDGEPACRCFRCGILLTIETLTVDRIEPGRDGGTYRRENIRPACQPCNVTIAQYREVTGHAHRASCYETVAPGVEELVCEVTS
jgi:hypothetical protein